MQQGEWRCCLLLLFIPRFLKILHRNFSFQNIKALVVLSPGLTLACQLLFLHFCRQLLNTICVIDFIIHHIFSFSNLFVEL